MRRRPKLRLAVGGVAVAATLAAALGPSYAATSSCVVDALPASDQSLSAAAVDFDSPTDGWIVGAVVGPEVDCEAETDPWAEHWNGQQWTDTPVPDWDCRASLAGVVAQSPTSAWAVNADWNGGGMALHWNGARWVEKPAGSGVLLGAIGGTPHSHIWAVGSRAVGSSGDSQVFRRANGAWRVVNTPHPGAAFTEGLTSIAVLSDTNVWAAGSYSPHRNGVPRRTLVLHWNGAKWTVFHPPAAGAYTPALTGIGAKSASDVWVAGNYFPSSGERTYTAHWDGTRWTRVPTPNSGSDELRGVAVNDHGGAWAVGTVIDYASGSARTLVLRWDGARWAVATSPNPNAGPNNRDTVNAVTAMPKGHAYAVGYGDMQDPSGSRYAPLAMTC